MEVLKIYIVVQIIVQILVHIACGIVFVVPTIGRLVDWFLQ
jgi:hypothetical protein